MSEKLYDLLVPQIEQELATDRTVAEIDCVIKALYDLGFAYYLHQNGWTEHDLQKDEFRRPTEWPATTRFVFSLQQMRDAYRRVAESPAVRIMRQHQIDEALAGNKPQHEFWTLLGEAPTVRASFAILGDPATMWRMRILSRAFRVVLFQQKISEYAETHNFLALLRTARKRNIDVQAALDACIVVEGGETATAVAGAAECLHENLALRGENRALRAQLDIALDTLKRVRTQTRAIEQSLQVLATECESLAK